MTGVKPVFENRYDAGRQLASGLMDYKGRPVVVLAIPNGGVPVALGVAMALDADLDLVVARKIPLPLSPEAGFGAVANDGITVILDEEVIKRAGLSPQQIDYQVSQVRANIRQRSLLYRQEKPPSLVSGKTVIIIDDGLAAGYTMKAAVESVRNRRPKEIVVAVPAASADAVEELEKVADRVITCAISAAPQFYLADFYRNWRELSDNEVLQCLREWRSRRFWQHIEPLQSK